MHHDRRPACRVPEDGFAGRAHVSEQERIVPLSTFEEPARADLVETSCGMPMRRYWIYLGRAWRFFGVPGVVALVAIALVGVGISALYGRVIHDHTFTEAHREATRVALRVEHDAGRGLTH